MANSRSLDERALSAPLDSGALSGNSAGKPRLLDLFCKAGGAARGYQRAGFYVVGVDIEPQPRYAGDEFIQADALTFPMDGFDVIHASPPCQAFTALRRLGKGAGEGALDLVDAMRIRLVASGVPWVIENVAGSPLRSPIVLCGTSFGLGVQRHRLFESSVPLAALRCNHSAGYVVHGVNHRRALAVYGDHPQDPGVGHINRARTLADGMSAMGIDWMTWPELTQAIPPAYTEYIGLQLAERLRVERAA